MHLPQERFVALRVRPWPAHAVVPVRLPSTAAGAAESVRLRQMEAREGRCMIPCLSVRQPWAWLIIYGGKTIENRTWSTQKRGRIGIHAGKGMTQAEYADVISFLYFRDMDDVIDLLPRPLELERGAVIGTVDLTGCVEQDTCTREDRRWFIGPHGLVLRDPKPLAKPVPWKGALGFFGVPESEFA
jgi:hypothetical protein